MPPRPTPPRPHAARTHAPASPRTWSLTRAVWRGGSVRFAKDEGGCYTVTGHILIAVNPFRKLGIYDETQAWLQRYEHPSATLWTVTGRSSPTSFH